MEPRSPTGVCRLMLLACPIRVSLPPPDPWEVFFDETLRPAFDLGVLAGLVMLGIAVVFSLVIGLGLRLPARDREVCAALPLMVGIATFILFNVKADPWWVDDPVRDNALPLALFVQFAGVVVLGRPLLVRS